ncbi:MAG: HNH endonuclease [Candidatus Spyradocola sp.]|jgi:5-methylcytosine-specific restriction endonuclease McrA
MEGKARVHEQESEERRLRSRQAWKRAKRLANERDHYLCALCLAEGVLNWENLETHHIVPLKDDPGLAYDVDNLVTLCRRHHEIAEGYPPGVLREKIEAGRNPRQTSEDN